MVIVSELHCPVSLHLPSNNILPAGSEGARRGLRELMTMRQTDAQRRQIYLNLTQPILQTALDSIRSYFQQLYRLAPRQPGQEQVQMSCWKVDSVLGCFGMCMLCLIDGPTSMNFFEHRVPSSWTCRDMVNLTLLLLAVGHPADTQGSQQACAIVDAPVCQCAKPCARCPEDVHGGERCPSMEALQAPRLAWHLAFLAARCIWRCRWKVPSTSR